MVLKEYESVHIRIKGKVQGVWFRVSAKAEADRLGIKGIVKNEPDGSVYVEAEGVENKIKTFIEWCKKGPEYAVVNEVVVKEQEFKNYQDFTIEK